MTILGSRKSFIKDELIQPEPYTIPAVFRHDDREMSLKKSIVLSTILHPTVAGLVALILFVLMLMGITFSIFDKPKPKINDITFVLVDDVPEQTPLNKTNIRSKKNTRAGGIRDNTKPVYAHSPAPSIKSVQQKAAPGPKAQKPAQHKSVSKPQNIFKSIMQPKAQSNPKPGPEARPKPPSARPSLKPPSVPRPTLRPASPFAVPIPKSSTTTGKSYSTGPIGGHGSAASGGSSESISSANGRYAPKPSLGPTGGGGSSSSGSRLSRSGSGYSGNPSGGSGVSGIDSVRDADFSAYTKYVERRIKMYWEAPEGSENKTAVIFFKIGKDGKLLSRSIRKSSGISKYDQSAINAIELAAPFKPLPVNYKASDYPINFTFDYNVK